MSRVARPNLFHASVLLAGERAGESFVAMQQVGGSTDTSEGRHKFVTAFAVFFFDFFALGSRPCVCPWPGDKSSLKQTSWVHRSKYSCCLHSVPRTINNPMRSLEPIASRDTRDEVK